ncbi:MFS transporter [Nocardia sp. NPDC059239]|uniref:MFS transporter n=1 Tax=Nocardia sp. NPDC059239 TaxID=3346785 RepID=UPI003695A6D5
MNNGNGAARRRALLAGAIGTFVEFYDQALYGFFAATIATLFFPKENPSTALLSTFAIFAVSFVVRPLGGVVWGHVGDKIGRRPALFMGVAIMSLATVAMGLLPGYDKIGLAAPILLLLFRLVQGFSVAGEYAGGTTFIVEHAPGDRRALYASMIPASSNVGTIFAALVAIITTSATSPEQLISWGWRIPFLLALPLTLIALLARLRVEESPVFTALQSEGRVESAPLIEAFKVAKKPMLLFIGWAMTASVSGYLVWAFLVSYLTRSAHFSNTQSLLVLIVALLVSTAGCVVAGRAIDIAGTKRVAIAYVLGLGIWAIPTFALLPHSSLLGAILIIAVFVIFSSGVATTLNLLFADFFPARVRVSASTLSYNICSMMFAGTAPFIATFLINGGHPLGPGYYLAGLAAISALVAVFGFSNQTLGKGRHSITPVVTDSPQPANA